LEKQARIAVLITAYKNEKQVNRLINHLVNDFDIYVHVDTKSNIKIVSHERVFVYKEFKIYWGNVNLVYSILSLLKHAHKNDYDRYLLITGQDLPTKTNSKITEFFSQNRDIEYIEMYKMPDKRWGKAGGMDRVAKYWPNHFHKMHGKWHKSLRLAFGFCKLMCNIASKLHPRPMDYEFWGGAGWFNLTHTCVDEIIRYTDMNTSFVKRFKHTWCSDEVFFQTIVNPLHGLQIVNDSLRYLNWDYTPGFPKSLGEEDFEDIIGSNAMFARKFDETIDNRVIEMIYTHIEEN